MLISRSKCVLLADRCYSVPYVCRRRLWRYVLWLNGTS